MSIKEKRGKLKAASGKVELRRGGSNAGKG